MAKLKIYEYPDPVLKQKAAPVEKVDDGLRRLLDDMLETMYAAAGVGLAAPQVGVLKRVIVIDTHDEEEGEAPRPLFLVNPEIIARSEEKICHEEGCLSVPDQHAKSGYVIWTITGKQGKWRPTVCWRLPCNMKSTTWTGFCISTASAG